MAPNSSSEFYIAQGTTFPSGIPGVGFPNALLPPYIAKLQPALDTFSLRPTLPQQVDQFTLRLSPSSNTQSVSPQLNGHKDPEARVNSTSEASDEEDIDVVRSAFQPIKPASLVLRETPDSTVQDKEPSAKCELKAPKRLISNECMKTLAKPVWRPY